MITRREFLKRAGVVGVSSAFGGTVFEPFRPRGKNDLRNPLADSEYPFPYDADYFQAAERVVFLDPLNASVNILPQEGKNLDIKLYVEQEDRIRLLQDKVFAFYGVNDSLDIPFYNKYRDPFFSYRIEYKTSQENSWKSTPRRTVKSPCVPLENRPIEVILIGDDHIPDDADNPNNPLLDKNLRQLRLSGETINYFLKKILADPSYLPQDEERHLMNAFCMGSLMAHISLHENPDFIVELGDHLGGFGHKWEGLGLKSQHLVTAQENETYVKNFRIATRKVFSAVSPNAPIYWALGNHDGEAGFYGTRIPAIKYRKKFFKMPGAPQGGSPDENYFSLVWGAQEGCSWLQEKGRGGVQILVLDCMRYINNQPRAINDWTLGETQKEWFSQALSYDAAWKFVFDHHMLGGWPSGSSEEEKSYSYGRGPLFSADDYKNFVSDPQSVEQVALTKLMGDNGVDFNVYGHDHIFAFNEMETQRSGRKMYGLCVGSPKQMGELSWYNGTYWRQFYGDYGDYYGNAKKADYWGPSGYTKLTISESEVRIDYIRAANNHPYTNIPQNTSVGDIIQSILI